VNLHLAGLQAMGAALDIEHGYIVGRDVKLRGAVISFDVVSVGVHPSVVPSTVEQRAEHRQHAMARYFEGQLNRFRIRPTVFMPALPPMFDLAQLDRLLVGLSDGEGGYSGVGYLEFLPDEGALRLNSPVADPPKALRLGSVRLDESYRAKRVDLRNLFGSE